MIITRTPLRLSLGGGGTDLQSYYSKYGGFFVASAVNKYIHIVVNYRFEPEIRVSYSATEIVNEPSEIHHPIVREALKLLEFKNHLDIISVADIPAKSGLGTSGSFTVALLKALYFYKGILTNSVALAEDACKISMVKLQEPSGKQDEYVASFGGLNSYTIDKDGFVEVSPLRMNNHDLFELQSNLLFFYTNITRDSRTVLSDERLTINNGGVEKLHKIKDLGFKSRDALVSGNLSTFGKLLDEHWHIKHDITENMSNDFIDKCYTLALENGAIGGKLIGAGGGGFLCVYVETEKKREVVRKVMNKEGLAESKFQLVPEGAQFVSQIKTNY